MASFSALLVNYRSYPKQWRFKYGAFFVSANAWTMACREFVLIGKRRDCQIRVIVNSEDAEVSEIRISWDKHWLFFFFFFASEQVVALLETQTSYRALILT